MVRGDWQLLPWLKNQVPDGQGGTEDNPLSLLARWKIFDNLRRSLSPVGTLAALVLGICFSGRAFAWAGGVAVLAAASNLLLSGAELAAGGGTVNTAATIPRSSPGWRESSCRPPSSWSFCHIRHIPPPPPPQRPCGEWASPRGACWPGSLPLRRKRGETAYGSTGKNAGFPWS